MKLKSIKLKQNKLSDNVTIIGRYCVVVQSCNLLFSY